MLLSTTIRLAPAALLLVSYHAQAQARESARPPRQGVRPTPAADTTRNGLLVRHQLGVLLGFGIATVNPEDDYYLPNDGIKAGSETAFTYTYNFLRQPPGIAIGVRTGIGFINRSGRYTFFGQDMRRVESFITVPLELVTRYRWQYSPRTYTIMSAGGYFSELATRYTYTLNPGTGKTDRNSTDWVYATGGITASFGIGFLRQRYSFREVGFRLSSDLFTPKAPDAGQLPNLRLTNLSLYYATTFGF